MGHFKFHSFATDILNLPLHPFRLIIPASGVVYVWGDNKHGQMALPSDQEKSVTSPYQVAGLSGRVTRVYSGWTHLLAETGKGQVINYMDGEGGGGPTKWENRGSETSPPPFQNGRDTH